MISFSFFQYIKQQEELVQELRGRSKASAKGDEAEREVRPMPWALITPGEQMAAAAAMATVATTEAADGAVLTWLTKRKQK